MVKAGIGIDGRDGYWSDRYHKNQIIPWLSKERPISLRYLLETIGTEWGRNTILSDLWTTLAERKLENSNRGIVVKDIRFPNELEWLDNMGGHLIYINRPLYFRTEATSTHPSNQPLPIREKDIVIENDDTLEVLAQRVVYALRDF